MKHTLSDKAEKILENRFCNVTGSLTINYDVDINCKHIVDQICERYPIHVQNYLLADIEHSLKLHGANNDVDPDYNKKLVIESINRVLTMYSIALDNLIVRQENIDSDLDALAETPTSSSSNPDMHNYSDHTSLMNYSSSAPYRYADLELLCTQFGHVCRTYRGGSQNSVLNRRPPRRDCQSFLVHETEWLNIKNNQK